MRKFLHALKVFFTSKLFIIFIISSLFIGLMWGVGYGSQYYSFVWRYLYEEDTDLTDTNTDSLQSEKQLETVLKKFPVLQEFGLDDLDEDDNYIIPGLKATKTVNTDCEEAMCTSMTPQGICASEKYIFITAYCHTKEHYSVIYMLDKDTHDYIKTIVVKGRYHLGNICYDPVYDNIWVACTGKNPASGETCAYLNYYTLESLENYDFTEAKQPLTFAKKYPIANYKNASYISYYRGNIFVGCYYTGKWNNSYITRFPINSSGGLDTSYTSGTYGRGKIAYGKEKAAISSKAQGVYLTDSYIMIMQSSGIKVSTIQFFIDSQYKTDIDEMISLEADYNVYAAKKKIADNANSEAKAVRRTIKALENQQKELNEELKEVTETKEEKKESVKEDLNKETTQENESTTNEDSSEESSQSVNMDLLDNMLDNIADNYQQDQEDEQQEEPRTKEEIQADLDDVAKKLEENKTLYEEKQKKYEDALAQVPDFDLKSYNKKIATVKTYSLTNKNAWYSMDLPPRLEQAMINEFDDKVYFLFESAAYAYRAQGVDMIDRVVVMNPYDYTGETEEESEEVLDDSQQVETSEEEVEELTDVTTKTESE